MMMPWVFALTTVGAAIAATFMRKMRGAVLALWVAGLSVGGLYLTLGAELLAAVQWIVSTMAAIALLFFSVMFGELNEPGASSVDQASAAPGEKRKFFRFRAAIIFPIASAAIGILFAALIRFGSLGLSGLGDSSAPASAVSGTHQGNDLVSLGRAIAEGHLLSLEVLALLLFLVLVGGGVIARPETKSSREDGPSGGPDPAHRASEGGAVS